ncbi:tetratricopeptide repeat protein [candidate division KSB1 bacterium]|nr:tetratricopeptide repeat protein [candidate division KSB1 bacterium]
MVALPVISHERRQIIDDARLTLGFIYYELGYFNHAYEFFKDISTSHENYKDALLGMGWALIKQEKYEECIKPLLKITKKYPRTANAEEAYFLLGQCYLKLNRFTEAIESYDIIIEMFPRHKDYSKYLADIQTYLGNEEKRLEQLETDLLVQESHLLEAIPVDGYANKPQYLKDEQKKIEKYRASLVDKIMKERSHIRSLKQTIEELRESALRKHRRKDWRGYAEYGKARALFLKEMQR